ncbi:hypothetical protein Xcel_1710 [Xylanimonas cellulosilytica DSM 15894]|uniref:PH domain-containing protein n=1 Tax=Xylanimonas cellulosilytica (strain DSM 15894 / JCM 12276 / CECT 5975 / KCTC 9989 / LMG 20990 / NBRC 107835 / XIL07) TaxID=446471 RepID=D1BSP1_XYLCX|nr:hypothetical protein [Xylanimonas cellulosilytica]ACZ30733.1 hypothetical protein Xcel_1710 [Xylanimonas cellulosilytica DSM 15894]
MNLPVPVAVGLWILLGVLLLIVVLGGRRKLAQRTGQLVPAPPAVPADPAELGTARLGPVQATYVSTTLAGDWLARVGAHGLGDTATAQVWVHDAGVLVERTGAPAVFLPVTTLRGAGLAPGMAGKYVGADGLVVLSWLAPSDGRVRAMALDTGLRTRYAADRSRIVDAVRHLLATRAPADAPTPAPADPVGEPPTDAPADPAATPKENL